MAECEYCGNKIRRKSFYHGKIVCSDCFEKLNKGRKSNRFKEVKGKLCPECKKNYLSRNAKRCMECHLKNLKRKKYAKN